MRRKLKYRRGLTLVEVVTASALLVIAVVPILRSLTFAHVTASAIERKTISLALAQGKLEQIRALSVYHYADSFTWSNLSLGNSYLCNVSDDRHPTLRTIAVSVGRDENNDGLLASGEIEVTLATYAAKRW